jgi:hypothetical protein
VAAAYAAVGACDTFPALRRLLAAAYAETDNLDSQRMLMVHLRRFHLRDPAEIDYWQGKRKGVSARERQQTRLDGPSDLEAARVAVAEALIQVWRDAE